jgi:hypothetical protein
VPVDVQAAVSMFGALSASEQIRFLVRVGWELTLVGRETYVVGGIGLSDPERLRVVNELQHRLLGHIGALLSGSTQRRPDASIVRTLLEHSEDSHMSGVARAFERAAGAFRAAS